jgi:AraC-like DNA-binding protein
MSTRIIPPLPAISHSIESYYFYSFNNLEPIIETYFPNGKTGIVIHFGEPVCFKGPNDEWQKMKGINFVSCVNFPVELKLSGNTDTLAIVLLPYSIYNIFRIRIPIMLASIDATSYFPVDFQRMLKALGSEEEKVIFLNDFFLEKLNHYKPEQDKFKTLCDYIIQTKGLTSRQQLSDLFGLSENYIHKMFYTKLGLSIKPFAQLVRISSILEDIYRGQEKDYFEILVKYGYFDQAHFIKDFKKLTGKTPSRYFRYDLTLCSLLAGWS